ncbi:hypothetical protein DYBT9275_00484 [Dyadobacter sp. CECT 9275]|uniref:Secretion system C-terminal sorting domain-containing protein n=1 Tax=Dyadobacter helix TaxID=2822344 RepID=A0A916N479_9BACT|nr:FG-GAP-like repeat-containing protein [Dyadobacter sp. CECT 9275]CAG4990233.1 hypothetical protein DYBT9275_00484 [Dyadobacter sp. CECT 9275]
MRTKYTSLLFLFIALAGAHTGEGQSAWFKADTLTSLSVNGVKLINPWAGGLNAMQFGKMRLNDDETEDLVVFDRSNSKITTYVAGTNPLKPAEKIFIHAPAYEQMFPKIDNWMILADYNRDGLKDLFASTSLGITVYRQVKTGNARSFVLEKDALYTKGLSAVLNLQVGGTDVPGIVDVDDDGDLDVLTFDFSGSYIELHQNLSMERYSVPDSLGSSSMPIFTRNGQCWGNFHKGDNNDFVFGDDCQVADLSGAKILHAGNSILLQDVNGDGNKDLLVGHVSNDHISVLYNAVAGIAADFTSFTHNYPEKDPIVFRIFPAVYAEDIDFDGVKDLIASPNVSVNEGNLMDFRSSNWYYHNGGTNDRPVYELVQKNFLQDQMVDVGENAAPSFFDVDGDGDLDMIVGTGGTAGTNGFRGKLWLFRNTGTAKTPAYELASDNYLDIPATLGLYNIKPQWADFNGDGIPDLGFAGINTASLKFEYRYIPNKSASGAAVLNVADAVVITMPSESQIGDSPFFHDADGDGDLDLLVGKPQGSIYYYINTGTGRQFAFRLETDAFAGVSINFEGRFSQISVQDIDLDGRPDLLTADHTGTIRIFSKADWGKWTARESLLINISDKASAPVLGRYLYAAVADYNGDGKPDVAVGTNAGGIMLFANILPITITSTEPGAGNQVKVYPNPASGHITILASQHSSVNILSVNGEVLRNNIHVQAGEATEIPLLNWPTGLYLLEVTGKGRKVVKKVVIK